MTTSGIDVHDDGRALLRNADQSVPRQREALRVEMPVVVRAVGEEAVWVANNGDGTITRIEP